MDTKANRKLRMGLVGGGEGAFIGPVHRMAAELDGQIELVCGAFSSDPEKSRRSGKHYFIDEQRCYGSYQEMLKTEASLPESERVDFISIVTPNHLHFPVAKMALEHGIHVLSDKPATFSLEEAIELRSIIENTGGLYALSHTYTGYPLIKHAKHLVASGELGEIKKIVVEYHQGWLASKDAEESKQASWRVDPRFGISCCVADIGVHAANLAEYVSGLSISSLCADLGAVVDGRALDDDASILMRLGHDVRGVLLSSQIAVGEENGLRLRIYGDKAGLDWSQQEPNSLTLRSNEGPTNVIRTGVGVLSSAAVSATRIPAGHPEGYLEAFANIYVNFAKMIRAHQSGEACSNEDYDVPGIVDAVRGMAFIEGAVAASQSEQKWHPFDVA